MQLKCQAAFLSYKAWITLWKSYQQGVYTLLFIWIFKKEKVILVSGSRGHESEQPGGIFWWDQS